MKKLVKTLILMPLAASLLLSCNKTGEVTYQGYMTAVSSIGTPYSCYFISDDSTILEQLEPGAAAVPAAPQEQPRFRRAEWK